jgi:hypothetical protein
MMLLNGGHLIELFVKSPSVSPPISSAFNPYPLFQWYSQSKEILLNMGLRVIIVVVQVGAVKIYGAGKRNCRMKLSLPPKLVEKLVWVPVISFCRIFIPSYTFDALLCQNWSFSPPNRLTLWTTLMHSLLTYVHENHLHFLLNSP